MAGQNKSINKDTKHQTLAYIIHINSCYCPAHTNNEINSKKNHETLSNLQLSFGGGVGGRTHIKIDDLFMCPPNIIGG